MAGNSLSASSKRYSLIISIMSRPALAERRECGMICLSGLPQVRRHVVQVLDEPAVFLFALRRSGCRRIAEGWTVTKTEAACGVDHARPRMSPSRTALAKTD